MPTAGIAFGFNACETRVDAGPIGAAAAFLVCVGLLERAGDFCAVGIVFFNTAREERKERNNEIVILSFLMFVARQPTYTAGSRKRDNSIADECGS